MRKDRYQRKADHTPVYARYLEVTPRPGESPEKMIRRFTKKVRNDGVLSEVYDRRHYEKPSVKVRRKRLRAKFNASRPPEKF